MNTSSILRRFFWESFYISLAVRWDCNFCLFSVKAIECFLNLSVSVGHSEVLDTARILIGFRFAMQPMQVPESAPLIKRSSQFPINYYILSWNLLLRSMYKITVESCDLLATLKYNTVTSKLPGFRATSIPKSTGRAGEWTIAPMNSVCFTNFLGIAVWLASQFE